ncbi:G-protein coupled receptor family C group 6 member A isoform X2 [Tachysurus fulvidraco]|uniref:G-protein coupled receptor family C group 6 member A isoform X2 n=1 Tax=Tachysurus fulvidraco TaxID=1234273 RepID=UPI001FEFEEFB|nr:G-protein coupled receptor family C group 6 member A isoform X2 [Tachysurus fulvidraco]
MKIALLMLLMILNLPSLKLIKCTEVFAPGNIIIGGLFPIHTTVEQLGNFYDLEAPCNILSPAGLAHSLAMIHAVETANISPELTYLGITLGYHIHDTCSDVTTTLRAVKDFTDDCMPRRNTSRYVRPVKAVIGAYNSEMSIAVARMLNLQLIPQISYASTADILSDKSRFPAFLRTVPSDVHQTSAMVQLLSERKWTWVGFLTTDGDYGRAALDSFISQATNSGICVAFTEILPDSLSNTRKLEAKISHTVHTIQTNPKAKVIVSFAKPEHMKRVFSLLMELSTDQRLWIASDNWSMAEDVLSPEQLERVGWVLGFSFKNKYITNFEEYVHRLELNSDAQSNNSFLKEFYSSLATSVNVSEANVSTATDKLIASAQVGVVFSIQMAVNAIAQAAAFICKNVDCMASEAIKHQELLSVLRTRSFELDGVSYEFNEDGDINLGYDVSLWNSNGIKVETLNVISHYQPSDRSLNTTELTLSLVSKCSKSCEPGQFKKSVDGQHTCCYECINCAQNQYTNNTDMDQCYSCDEDSEWSESGSSACNEKRVEFFSWSDPFAMVLLSLSVLGVVVVFAVSVVFLLHRDSPVVKAAGGSLCQLILLSLSGSFVSAMLFVGKPTALQCKVRQVLYGLSFTVCVSCILVKSLKILLAFHMNLLLKQLLYRLYKPYAIVSMCVALQVVTCACWLILKSPESTSTVFLRSVLQECDEGSYVAFGVMLGYIALLALVCFAFAFQGRKLPHKYNEAKFITFGMLIYLIAWIIFIPTYVNTKGKYLPAVEMIVILISCYAILSCHFFPKCYIILFRKTQNTRDAFVRSIYEYSKKTVGNIHPPQTEKYAPYAMSNPSFVPKE